MRARSLAMIGAFVAMGLVVAYAGFLLVSRDAPTVAFPSIAGPAPESSVPSMPQGTPVSIPQSLRTQLHATAPAGQPVITTRAAEQLIEALVPVRNEALLNADRAALEEFETGVALEADIEQCLDCIDNLGIFAASVGPYGIADAVAFVPEQSSYPAWFAAEVLLHAPADGRTFREIIAMTRARVDDPWRVALVNLSEHFGAGRNAFPGASDANGFNLRAEPRISPIDLVAALAGQWRHYKERGEPDPTTPFRTDEGADFADPREGAVNEHGFRGDYEYRIDESDGTFAVALKGGDTLVCGAIRVRIAYSAGRYGDPVQNKDRTNWGFELAPGRYTQIVNDRIYQPCMVLPAQGDVERVWEGDQSIYATGIK